VPAEIGIMIIRRAELKDAEAIGRVQVNSWRTTYRGIVPDAFLDTMTYAVYASRWHGRLSDPSNRLVTYVACEDDGTVFGFASGGVQRIEDMDFDGELYAIYLLQANQRCGAGRLLVQAVAQGLVGHGFKSMLVWVLEANEPARRFYERLGGVYAGVQSITIGGKELVEVAYGWRDLAGLISEPHEKPNSRQ
jgi:GNAT superfamily N-acetyltransferase